MPTAIGFDCSRFNGRGKDFPPRKQKSHPSEVHLAGAVYFTRLAGGQATLDRAGKRPWRGGTESSAFGVAERQEALFVSTGTLASIRSRLLCLRHPDSGSYLGHPESKFRLCFT
jgi:hypothetical protein